MIKVRFFGVLRIDYKTKYLEVDEAKNIAELIEKIVENTEIPLHELKKCSFIINNKVAKFKSSLNDGDDVMVLIPVAGG